MGWVVFSDVAHVSGSSELINNLFPSPIGRCVLGEGDLATNPHDQPASDPSFPFIPALGGE